MRSLSLWHWLIIGLSFVLAAQLLAPGVSALRRKALVSDSLLLFVNAIVAIIGLFWVWHLLKIDATRIQ